jgi:hypothetical protein
MIGNFSSFHSIPPSPTFLGAFFIIQNRPSKPVPPPPIFWCFLRPWLEIFRLPLIEQWFTTIYNANQIYNTNYNAHAQLLHDFRIGPESWFAPVVSVSTRNSLPPLRALSPMRHASSARAHRDDWGRVRYKTSLKEKNYFYYDLFIFNC